MLELNKIHLGDCYELIKQIPDKSIDCIYTDVPYLYNPDNLGGGGSSELAKRIIKVNKELENEKIVDGFAYKVLDDFVRVLRKINIIIWFSKAQMQYILNYFMSLNKEIYFEPLVWLKQNPIPATNNAWLPDIEYAFHFREKGVRLNDGYELKSKWYLGAINKRDKDLYEHPTIKPLALVKRHIKHVTQPKDIILDPFMGSGTTAVAARETGRQFIGFEIEPKWHKIACDRVKGITAAGQYSLFGDIFCK